MLGKKVPTIEDYFPKWISKEANHAKYQYATKWSQPRLDEKVFITSDLTPKEQEENLKLRKKLAELISSRRIYHIKKRPDHAEGELNSPLCTPEQCIINTNNVNGSNFTSVCLNTYNPHSNHNPHSNYKLNFRGIRSKKEYFLNNTIQTEVPHFIAGTETWLNPSI